MALFSITVNFFSFPDQWSNRMGSEKHSAIMLPLVACHRTDTDAKNLLINDSKAAKSESERCNMHICIRFYTYYSYTTGPVHAIMVFT